MDNKSLYADRATEPSGNPARRAGFSGRSLVSVTTAWAFVALVATGAILYVVPPGRIANWTGWTLLGLTKAQWQGLHVSFAALFVLASAFHVYLNWRALLGYFMGRASKALALRVEWILATAVCALVAGGSLAGLPPFSSLQAWEERIKESWDRREERPPVPHAELLTLGELAAQEGLPFARMQANLRAKGIVVDSQAATVGEIAAAHGMTPSTLYDAACGVERREERRAEGKSGGGGAGQGGGGLRGMGRVTLAEYCAARALNVEAAIGWLAAQRIEATAQMTMREIADRAGVDPRRIRDIMELQE